MTVSMKDVAKAAGVSQPSVSYAYNHPTRLSEAQRERILKIAEQLGYPGPDVRGRSLRSGRIGAIGLMMMDKLPLAFADPFMVALLQGISETEGFENFALTLFPMNNRVALANVSDAPQGNLAFRGLVDGLIIATLPDDHPAIAVVAKRVIPFVVVDSPLLDVGFYVGIDDRAAARSQIRHLLDLGHRRIGVLMDRLAPDGYMGPVNSTRLLDARERVTRERVKGYLEAVAEVDLGLDNLIIVEAGGLDHQAGRLAAINLLSASDLTAIVGCSDVMALSTFAAAEELGISVPGELSIVGFDDIPAAQKAGLTTVRQPMIEKGHVAAKHLMNQLSSPGLDSFAPVQSILSTELIVRASTGVNRSNRRRNARAVSRSKS